MIFSPVTTGATIGLVSPASFTDHDTAGKGIAFLEGLGFRTKVFPHALGQHLHFSGTDAERTADIQAAFADPEVDAVLCIRGGYGSARIVSLLDTEAILRHPKPFLGYSDVTTLHLALEGLGIPSFYSPVLTTFAEPRLPWVIDSFLGALAGDFSVPKASPPGVCLYPGTAKGIASGGCLTLIADSLGTSFAFNGRGKIVLIEDIGEKPHRVDAMLTHLLNAGSFEGAAGFVFGEMTSTDGSGSPHELDWQSIVQERLTPLRVPVITNYPFGHISAMLTIPLGVPATLDAGRGTLTFAQGGG